MSEYKRSGVALEERIPPDILWLLRRTGEKPGVHIADTRFSERSAMYDVIQKGAAGYTQIVKALADRCFDLSVSGRVNLHYDSILDIIADPGLLDLYKIDTPRRRSEQSPGEVS